MTNSKDMIIENFKKVEKSILSLTNEKTHFNPSHKNQTDIQCQTLIMRFERALEIICNIFFRAVEIAEFGELSGNTDSCIIKMKHLSLITSEEIWKNMIMSRSNITSPLPENQQLLYEKILTQYIEELHEFCKRVRKRYNIQA